MSYLEQPRIFGTIVGSFFFVFVPLAGLALVPNTFPWLPELFLLQAVGLGVTHFFITLALYANRENARYFAGGGLNRVVYFGVPLAVLVFFAAAGAFGLREHSPFFALYFFPAIRILDFVHVGRQSFGVTQLLKRTVVDLPKRLRTLENWLFVALALLEWQTFLGGGRFASDSPAAVIPAGAVALLFVAVVTAYARHADETKNAARIGRPLLYVILQTVSAAAAIYRTRLYLVALTMHYVEYHLLIGRRLFGASDSVATPERGTARGKVVGFYVVLLLFVVLFEARTHAAPDLPAGTRVIVHLFDGIFVVHYFVEAFVWKFTNPFYRRTLSGLYFDERAATRPKSASVLEAGCVALAAVLGAFGLFHTSAVQHRLLRPMQAQQHLDWGMDLAERGQLDAAEKELVTATEMDPTNREAEAVLAQTRRFRREQPP